MLSFTFALFIEISSPILAYIEFCPSPVDYESLMFYSTGSSCVTFLGEILDFVIVEFAFIKKDRISYFEYFH
jgi:hypothetical protein